MNPAIYPFLWFIAGSLCFIAGTAVAIGQLLEAKPPVVVDIEALEQRAYEFACAARVKARAAKNCSFKEGAEDVAAKR